MQKVVWVLLANVKTYRYQNISKVRLLCVLPRANPEGFNNKDLVCTLERTHTLSLDQFIAFKAIIKFSLSGVTSAGSQCDVDMIAAPESKKQSC